MQQILVLPRESFDGLDGFLPWSRVGSLLKLFDGSFTWMPRSEAECSRQWVQPIPCAIFRDSSGRYCVFRQARQERRDLSHRVSFVIGGHIDGDSESGHVSVVFEETVKREALEEVGIVLSGQLKPVGMVVDATSMLASRHVGFVYEAVIDGEFKSRDAVEFSIRSKYNGQFLSIESISKLSSKLDPWSYILFYQYMSNGFPMGLGRQSNFLVPTE